MQIDEIVSKLKNEIYKVLDGQFYLNDGTKVTYNPCIDPKYKGCFYCSVIDKNGIKQKTIIIDLNSGKQVG